MQEDLSGKEPIKVVLADDRTLFRQGLAGLLASYGGIELAGQTENDQEAIALARKHNPNVVIMQVQLPIERAKKALKQLREVSPPPKVVLVAMFDDPSYVQEFLKLGVSAYLLKSASIEQLIGAIRAAYPEGRLRRQRIAQGAYSLPGRWRSSSWLRVASQTARSPSVLASQSPPSSVTWPMPTRR